MTARLYGNENFDLQVVEHLRNLGHDVLTAHEAGKASEWFCGKIKGRQATSL